MIRSTSLRAFTVLLCTFALTAAACDEKKPDSASASAKSTSSAAPKSTGSAAATPAKPAATPASTPAATPSAAKSEDPAANLPEKGPWEAVKLTFTKDDPKPTFKMENLGRKPITVCFIDFYGYDDKGKQLAHETLSWNGKLEGGKSDDSVDTKKVDGVKKWEATYHGIKFDGDKEVTMDDKRAPAQRKMGG